MNCPFCHYSLTRNAYNGLEIDYCSRCKGLWFDPGELDKFVDSYMESKKDLPDAKIELNKKIINSQQVKEQVKTCPACDALMSKLNYSYDSNVILDKCGSCDGVWADGGEVYKIAVYSKGNPHLNAYGESLAKHNIRKSKSEKRFNVLITFVRMFYRLDF